MMEATGMNDHDVNFLSSFWYKILEMYFSKLLENKKNIIGTIPYDNNDKWTETWEILK